MTPIIVASVCADRFCVLTGFVCWLVLCVDWFRRSERSQRFRAMADHMNEMWEDMDPGEDDFQSGCISVEIENLMTDVAGRLRNETYLRQHLHRIYNLTDKLYLDVYPN